MDQALGPHSAWQVKSDSGPALKESTYGWDRYYNVMVNVTMIGQGQEQGHGVGSIMTALGRRGKHWSESEEGELSKSV